VKDPSMGPRWHSPGALRGLSAGSQGEPPRRISCAGAARCGVMFPTVGETLGEGAVPEMRRGAGAERPRAQPRSPTTAAAPRVPVRAANRNPWPALSRPLEGRWQENNRMTGAGGGGTPGTEGCGRARPGGQGWGARERPRVGRKAEPVGARWNGGNGSCAPARTWGNGNRRQVCGAGFAGSGGA